jgi:hypothetical protein
MESSRTQGTKKLFSQFRLQKENANSCAESGQVFIELVFLITLIFIFSAIISSHAETLIIIQNKSRFAKEEKK